MEVHREGEGNGGSVEFGKCERGPLREGTAMDMTCLPLTPAGNEYRKLVEGFGLWLKEPWWLQDIVENEVKDRLTDAL